VSVALKIVDKRFACDGATTVFALANLIYLANADLKVWLVDADGTPHAWTLGVQYTLTGNGALGAGVLTAAGAGAFDNTHAIYVLRDTDNIQNQVFTEGGGFPAKNAENAYDRRTLKSQEHGKAISLAIKAPATDPTTDLTLQPVPQRAGFVTVFDDLGRLVASTLTAVQLASFTVASDLVLLLQQLVASLSGDYLFAQPTDKYLNTPVGGEAAGYRALVGKAPTGVFAGKRGRIAVNTGTNVAPIWIFSPLPRAGQRVFDNDTQLWWASQNGWWNKLRSLTPGAVYQDFRDIPDGTLANGILIATGQQMSIGAAGGVNSLVNNGRYEPTDNSYITFNFPFKELRMSVTGMYRASGAFGALVLAAGRRVAGEIITKMNHTEFLYQSQGDLSIWGGPRQTLVLGVPIGSLATGGLQYHYRASVDLNSPEHGLSQLITHEMVIQGNVVRCYADGRRLQDAYRDDMVSGSCGDGAEGAGYVYFQTGGDNGPTLPYVYEIFAEPLPINECLPDPLFVPDPGALPIVRAASCTFASATEVTRFTPVDGLEYAFEVDCQVISTDPLGPYAQVFKTYYFLAKKYAGAIVVGTQVGIGSQIQLSTNPANVALSEQFTLAVVGNDVLLKETASRTGTDATAYLPQARFTIRTFGAGANFA
jgi:hypothetical protein